MSKNTSITLIIIVFLLLATVGGIVRNCTDPEYIRECRLEDHQEWVEDSLEKVREFKNMNIDYSNWIVEDTWCYSDHTYIMKLRKPNTGYMKEIKVGYATYKKAKEAKGQQFKTLN